MKRILLLTDFSDAAVNAIHFALRFWSGATCEFYLAHIQDSSDFTSDNLMSYPSSVSIYDSLVKDSKNKLKLLEKNLFEKYSYENYSFKSIVDVDGFTDAINQLVQLNDIDQVVLGSNGVSSLKEVFFGSHALMAMRSVNCHVLVIPNTYKFQKSEILLFILDERDELSSAILTQLSYLAQLGQWKIEIVRFLENAQDEKVAAFDKEIPITLTGTTKIKYSTVKGLSLSNVVEDLVQTRHIGLVVMLNNFKSFLSRLTSRANKSELGKLGKVPIMSLKT